MCKHQHKVIDSERVSFTCISTLPTFLEVYSHLKIKVIDITEFHILSKL